MLNVDNTVLVVIDVQEKLARAMYEREELIENLQKLIKGIKVLEVPIIWLEQNPRGLGSTVPEIAQLLSDLEPISKFSFSCCASESFMKEMKTLKRNHVLLAGIETHVCVYQTARDLVNLGYKVQVVADTISSRTAKNKQIGLERIKEVGGSLTSVETALFELLKVAEGPKFKEILKIVK
ncbi:hydrolase [Candidatus Oleimmundimicrobium sp.]|uniref:hydrolase n=1 Tax=Candidatus Oleimmundimicrobium sp. TaxID=3060597 RepID=UPI00271E918B|nr:hydrolase [Candidatus Oleimmundimicrobium sp.]MDO8885861.1 hydrolase [Candidatus Oleimmundimicrobium sp.]